jgi:hypothetical protein
MSFYGTLEMIEQLDMETMKIKFGGGNEIDANTLINSLIHFTNVVQEVNKGVSTELNIERKIEIKIKANEPGSFVVDMSVLATTVGGALMGLFSKEMVSYASNVVQVVGGVYNFAQILKGKKPQSVKKVDNTIQITTIDGNTTFIDFSNAQLQGANLYIGNPIIQAAIAKEFETLNADNNVTDFSLLDKADKTIAIILKEEFEDMAEPEVEEIIIGEDKKVVTVSAILQIKEQDWAFKKAWVFYMNGHRIPAKIKDDKFIQRVLGGQDGFFAGDSLDVILEITQNLDKVGNIWVNKSYSVKEIKSHIKAPKQPGLFK